ncbi:hypothetical protein [Ochrobactrum sp. AP1BH01-1]|uniref:5-methylcytosine restriction system specificity protein McrC n=1 Tax=Ochrobactrum sp. AP1BH01-1 TaxID=2823874 RepID=UPI000DDA0627|nr:hypothetical protein [Ochrobactrum sp. AP1BH01-1]
MTPSNDKKINIALESRKSCEVDISQLFHDGVSQIFPFVEHRGYLFLQFRQSKAVVSAGPFVGRIPLTRNITIEVTPRLPVRSVARIVDVAHGDLVNLTETQHSYRSESNSILSIFEFVARDFAGAIKAISTNGFHKEYTRRTHESSQFRGKLDFTATIKRCWSVGNTHEVVTSRFEHLVDISVNRVLRSACELLLQNAIKSGIGSSKEFVELANFLRHMPNTIRRATSSDLQYCFQSISKRSLPACRDYYYKPLSIAIMALSDNYISIQSEGNDIEMSGFLINFETLFENYLRNILQARNNEEFWVLDGNNGGQKPLFDDRKNPPAQPDIVIKEKTTKKSLVVEVKYKDKPNRDDINQVISYALAYDTKNVVVVTQKRPDGRGGLSLIGRIKGIALHQYYFDLNASSLEDEERNFSECIFGLADFNQTPPQ